MKRRSICTAIGLTAVAGLSGCIATSTDGSNENDTSDAEDLPPKPASARRKVEITSVDDVPNDVPVSASIELQDPWITDQRTAVLDHRITNTGSEAREVQALYDKGASSSSGAAGFIAYDRGEENTDRAAEIDSEGCWETSESTTEHLDWTTENPPSFQLAPGETGAIDLVVADDPTVDGCFPTGQYRFEESPTIAGTEFTWGFTISVSDASDA